MNDFCNRCGICCRLIPIDIEGYAILRNGVSFLDEEFFESLIAMDLEEARNINEIYVEKVLNSFPQATFYRCKFISPANLCTKLEIPPACQDYPSHPFACIPDECGYYGEIFIKAEEIKQKIRKYKEEIVYYEAMIASGCKEEKVYLKIITSLNRFIEKYAPYGSEDW